MKTKRSSVIVAYLMLLICMTRFQLNFPFDINLDSFLDTCSDHMLMSHEIKKVYCNCCLLHPPAYMMMLKICMTRFQLNFLFDIDPFLNYCMDYMLISHEIKKVCYNCCFPRLSQRSKTRQIFTVASVRADQQELCVYQSDPQYQDLQKKCEKIIIKTSKVLTNITFEEIITFLKNWVC